ncbi:peptidyl-prolyl cis-trans isomerase [Alkalibacter rhizosphaerae]|uniref:Peptidyl-prolyl cis-trans isomerase n=1 Tax=Alkalibacter rhizosphaerae TaxID=2815577 RepID=A0A975AHA7_9FIRM|nr:peptidyl-prolyl cis-trans isomerase [Alkalibacter rhizosphaerae]QSX07434.1 peptidyl-prolyl cis-trans isomerase [Alkalibacter rhizosphaerae]
MKKFRWIAVLISVLLMVGCTSSQSYLAKVDEVVITEEEWKGQLLLTQISYDLSQTPMPSTGEAYENLKKNLMDNLLESVVLLEEAQERAVEGDDTAADEEARMLMDAITTMYDEGTLSELLDEYDMDPEKLEALLVKRSRENQVIYELYEEVTKEVSVSQTEMEEYYNGHLKLFNYSTVHAKGFVFADLETATAVEKDVREMDDGQEVFETYKDRDGVLFSGDFGPVFYTDVEVPFADALFDAAIGEWTPLVETDGRAYLGYVYGKEPMDPIPLEEVSDLVQERALSEKRGEFYRTFVEDAFEKRDVDVHYDKL